jgi:Fe-S-cluster containining protein
MSRRKAPPPLAIELEAAAADYQRAVVIPHCAQCSRPCCRLDPLVLELDWRQLRTLWQIEDSRASFDRRLASGQGPREIRAADGLYFVHGKTCPAYDEGQHTCRIYGQDLKPTGCTDFPVYLDYDCIVADLRCEAVKLDELVAWIARAAGPGYRVVQSADKDFPFMVTVTWKRIAGRSDPADNRPEKGKSQGKPSTGGRP